MKASVIEQVPKSLSLCEKAVAKVLMRITGRMPQGRISTFVLIGNRDFMGRASVVAFC